MSVNTLIFQTDQIFAVLIVHFVKESDFWNVGTLIL